VLAYDPHLDAYAVLGAHPEATQEEIEAAYRQAARTWHPDKSPAPDAAERFRELQEAAAILRRPTTRRQYDRLRKLHYGVEPPVRKQTEPPRPYVPLPTPPAWLPGDVRVVRDSVIFPVKAPRPLLSELAVALCFLALLAAFLTGELTYALVALVGYVIVRVQAQPPETGRIAWAKLTPGQKLAEYTALDRRVGLLVRYEIPFAQLHVLLAPQGRGFKLELAGFPGGAVVLHAKIKGMDEARKRGRAASQWLGLPLVLAA
jgi:hypothetical protein